ncbi:MAG: hypothetical protein LBT97_03215 [Planctomycetota bacterium]|jgi:hypothetical protein|nr:hypothetical protein [Planctomycetota bacterium]
MNNVKRMAYYGPKRHVESIREDVGQVVRSNVDFSPGCVMDALVRHYPRCHILMVARVVEGGMYG